jgi:NAD(P)-dependent dehydrogenase (short-subunit alcohol dehydrogenase family)
MSAYLEELFGLAGRTAVVTGGGGVLGGAIAEAFAAAGARIVLWDRVRDRLETRARRIGDLCDDPGRALVVETDLAEESAVEAALGRTLELAGGFEVLVNAAGGNLGKAPFPDFPGEQAEAVVRLNWMAGCWLPLQHAARHWIEAGVRGAVINIASMAAERPLSGVAAYSASKAAVVSLTRATARELAPHGIRVNALSPGFFVGEQNRALLLDPDSGELTQRGREVVDRTPFGRFGEPEELAGACLLLASERAGGFITGAVLPVDGGFGVESI